MSSSRFSRRALLQSMGLSAALLPLISTDKALSQAAGGFPKRLVTVTWGNGIVPEDLYPPGTDLVIGETLKALETWASKMVVIEGLDLQVMLDYPDRKWDGHFSYPTLLSGTADPGFEVKRALGPSLDVIVANHLATQVSLPFPLINIGVRTGGEPTSWRDVDQPNEPEQDAARLFERLFAGASMPEGMVNTLLLKRQSVLDYVGTDLESFGQRLGTEDRVKVEAHLSSIRELEARISNSPTGGAACTQPTLGTGDDTPSEMKNMFDLAAAAIRCDATRVVNIDLYHDGGADGNSFSWLGIDRDYHAVAHDGSAAYPEKLKIDAWIYEEIAGMVAQLDAAPEGDVTALDNTVILTCNDMEEGASHSVEHVPFVLIGSCGGYLKTGHAVHYGGQPHNLLLTTLANAMGLEVNQIGESYSGNLPDLIA